MVQPAKRPKGITCPACAVRLRTRRVIPLANGSVRRIRRCKDCGFTTSTTERANPPATPATPYHP